MVYLLTTPETRKKISFTQAFLLIMNIVILILFSFVVGTFTAKALFPGELDVS